MGEGRNMNRVLVENLEGKSPLEGPRCRWEHGIGMDLILAAGVCSGFNWHRIGTGGGLW
jgi:hypothetical protein